VTITSRSDAQGSSDQPPRVKARQGQCFGMTPEKVRLDVAEADEFSLVCQSLLGACP
jgi:hypothetical protein